MDMTIQKLAAQNSKIRDDYETELSLLRQEYQSLQNSTSKQIVESNSKLEKLNLVKQNPKK